MHGQTTARSPRLWLTMMKWFLFLNVLLAYTLPNAQVGQQLPFFWPCKSKPMRGNRSQRPISGISLEASEPPKMTEEEHCRKWGRCTCELPNRAGMEYVKEVKVIFLDFFISSRWHIYVYIPIVYPRHRNGRCGRTCPMHISLERKICLFPVLPTNQWSPGSAWRTEHTSMLALWDQTNFVYPTNLRAYGMHVIYKSILPIIQNLFSPWPMGP